MDEFVERSCGIVMLERTIHINHCKGALGYGSGNYGVYVDGIRFDSSLDYIMGTTVGLHGMIPGVIYIYGFILLLLSNL